MIYDEINWLPDDVRKLITAEEKIHWSGNPNWKSLGYHAFGIKYLVIYFVISGLYAVSQLEPEFSFSAFVFGFTPYIISGLIAGLILYGLAYLAARHSVYVITERRVVIRTGIALVFLLNLPIKNILSIDKQSLAFGNGNLSFKVQSKKRIPYSSCWPSVRSGSFIEPVPAFRNVPNIDEISDIISEIAERNRELKLKVDTSLDSGVAA